MELETFTQKFQSYSGLFLVLFVTVHLAGIIFAGVNPNAFETYALNLHSSKFLPYFEALLITTFIIHILLTLKKVLKNRSYANRAVLKSKRNDYLGILSSKIQPFSGVILASFLIIHLFQLRFPRPGDNLELISLKIKLEDVYTLVLYSLASISLFFHMTHGIESSHRSLGILSQSNSLNIKYISRFVSILFGLSYLIMTFYLRIK